MEKTVIIIGGPTAVGKSALALDLAQALSATIISADSRQVYKEMSIGTAKPSKAELDLVKHHLVDHVSLVEPFNAGIFERTCDQIVQEEFKTKDVVVMCGGTGLYINAFLNGLDHFPQISNETKLLVEQFQKEEGKHGLFSRLQTYDPEYANVVDKDNQRRLVRALHVCIESEKPYSYWLNNKPQKEKNYRVLKYWLNLDRTQLYDKINARVECMFENGWEKEAQQLVHHKSLKALDTLGYTQLFAYLEGRVEYSTCVEDIKTQTRRYAKRQITWFSNQYAGKQLNGEFRAESMKSILDEL